MARRTERSGAWIGEVVSGRRRPSEDLAQKIAEVLDVPAEDLFARPEPDVVVSFVRRTTAASSVPERVDDPAAAEEVGRVLRGGAA